MKARVLASEALARALIAQIDAEHGYPRVEPGVYRGDGRHIDVVTTTDHEPVRLKDGTWAVRSDRLALARLPVTGERDIKADVEAPADVRAIVEAVVEAVEDEKP